ncbi:MAG TPA: hypothetical protein VE776_13715 [Actinomycetota bacterium]|jgi:hypothetical protein|nr:hypothetical protein [Actinomycetota bacterium]
MKVTKAGLVTSLAILLPALLLGARLAVVARTRAPTGSGSESAAKGRQP